MRRLLGAHVSIAGGFPQAVERAFQGGFSAAQIFLKNCQQWRSRPLSREEASEFRQKVLQRGIYFFGHAGYLLNLSSPDRELSSRSLRALVEETSRAYQLGLPFVVVHPGTRGSTSEESALERCEQKLRQWVELTKDFPIGLAIESMPGAGTQIGSRLEQLTELLARLADPRRFGLCLDTAHLWAAGYDWSTPEGYQKLIQTIQSQLGEGALWAIHLNDSWYPLGSRKDRHQHIGEGTIGLEPFRLWMTDSRWAQVPMVLETPKGQGLEEDKQNLARLRSLLT